ncbi:cytochrome b/b6 domain-containing protein [Sphingomonas sp. 37zxx]|uniref:cytochrome b/b6 domain-containing protein n=1 Tax=Sphingomonas sp. 37zxx TaxID=1550073 RepID=UPI00068DE279|nr:cytochrome b/b6 domain-containing protein [Sphingomonas sp. 37zxx]
MNRATIAAPTIPKTIGVWDLPVRLFHWLLVAIILVSFLSAEEDSGLAAWHFPAGWIAAVLIAFRLAWGFVGGEHARFAGFLKPARLAHHIGGLFSGKPERSIGHNALGGMAIVALLGTVAGIIYTGATMQGDAGEELHETLGNILLGLIALHVVGVVVMSLLTKDNLVAAFITGRKRADLHPGMPDARPPARLAVPVAALAIGAAAYGVTLIDPVGFNPGAHAQGETTGDKGEGSDD